MAAAAESSAGVRAEAPVFFRERAAQSRLLIRQHENVNRQPDRCPIFKHPQVSKLQAWLHPVQGVWKLQCEIHHGTNPPTVPGARTRPPIRERPP